MTEYAVVKGNSTSGGYIVEPSTPSQRRASMADIAYVTSSKKKAQKVADALN